jgi:valyl-tRNA synthetase
MSHNRFPTANPAVITCGLPYANGELHIGHLRTYISGDVLARALRKLGQPTAFVRGCLREFVATVRTERLATVQQVKTLDTDPVARRSGDGFQKVHGCL